MEREGQRHGRGVNRTERRTISIESAAGPLGPAVGICHHNDASESSSAVIAMAFSAASLAALPGAAAAIESCLLDAPWGVP